MKTLQPFFKGYWQTATPFYLVLLILEFLKPGLVQSRVHMTAFFITILIVFTIEVAVAKSTIHQER